MEIVKSSVKRANQTLGVSVSSGKLSLTSRRIFHMVIQFMQQDGDKEIYSRDLSFFLKGINYKSKDLELVKDAFRALMETSIIWNTTIGGMDSSDNDVWTSETTSRLVSELTISENGRGKKTIVEWSFSPKLKQQLLVPDRFTIFNNYYFEIKTNPALMLFEIIERYKTNPTLKTVKKEWQWWVPVLTGRDSSTEYKYFKRDVILKAITELNNLITEYSVELVEFKEVDKRSVSSIQFKINKVEKEIQLIPEVEQLSTNAYYKLIDFGLTESEAKKIFNNYEESYIEETLLFVKNRISNQQMDEVKNVFGYLKKALSEQYIKTIPVKPTKQEKLVNKEVVTKKNPYPPNLIELFSVQRKKDAMVEYNASQEIRKKTLITNFFEINNNETIISAYKKNGFGSSIFKQSFFEWLATYLWGEITEKALKDFQNDQEDKVSE